MNRHPPGRGHPRARTAQRRLISFAACAVFQLGATAAIACEGVGHTPEHFCDFGGDLDRARLGSDLAALTFLAPHEVLDT